MEIESFILFFVVAADICPQRLLDLYVDIYKYKYKYKHKDK